jgi:hypothetical protein
MKTKLLIGIICLIIADVIIAIYQHNKNYEKDFPIDQKARNFLSFYKPNAIWTFENSKWKRDTILISVDSAFYPPSAGFLAPAPHKYIRIHFTELKQSRQNEDEILGDGNLNIEKDKYEGRVNFWFYHGDFRLNTQDTITKSDSLLIDSVLFTKYLDIYSRQEPEFITATSTTAPYNIITNSPNPNYHPLDIIDIYWVNKYGILAYKLQNDDIWKRTNIK